MSPQIFITGVGGYVGGQAAVRLFEKHPDWSVTALVRDETQEAAIKKRFPSVKTVIGDLDNNDLLAAESAKADVVLNLANSDHIGAVKTIISGLKNHKPSPGHLIHISGTGMLADFANGPGNPAPKIYSDVADVAEITSMPLTAFHRDVDQAVIDGGIEAGVPTAIISPPTIFGLGEGPLKKRSIQIPWMIEGMLKRGKGFKVEKGENYWDGVHVDDLAQAFVVLAEEGMKGKDSKAEWGAKGYYFCEAGEFQWGTIAASLAGHAHKLGALPTAEIDTLSADDAAKVHPWAPLIWGSNCRSRAERLKGLGWKPKAKPITEYLEEMVKAEVQKK